VSVLRSRKYSQLSDADILKLYKSQPGGEELYFLNVEIEQRNLTEQARAAINESRKESRHSLLYYLFYALMFAFFVARFGSDFSP
jgi:hypothetical protein